MTMTCTSVTVIVRLMIWPSDLEVVRAALVW